MLIRGKEIVQYQQTPLVAEKDRLPALTETVLPIITPEMVIMRTIVQPPIIIIARAAESFPRAVAEQMSARLRAENPIINIHANNPQDERGRNRLKDYEYRGSRSRGSCNACEGGQEQGHHGGRRCRRGVMLRSGLKLQQSPIKINISRLPSKTSVL